jgi:hypothetical protein
MPLEFPWDGLIGRGIDKRAFRIGSNIKKLLIVDVSGNVKLIETIDLIENENCIILIIIGKNRV